MGNKINSVLLKMARYNAQNIGTEMSMVNGTNFMDVFVRKEAVKMDICSKFIRWMLTPNECLVSNYQEYLLHVDSRDAVFAFSFKGVQFYFACLRLFGQDGYWQSNQQMDATLGMWNPTRVAPRDGYPLDCEFMSFEGLEWFFSTSAELTDQLKRDANGYFFIDTYALNNPKYIRKEGFDLLGCRAIFDLTLDGFILKSVEYKNVIYERHDSTPDAKYALRALYGGYSLIRTILSHAIGIHLLSSAKFVLAIRKIFPINHLIRQVLVATELMSVNGIARALNTLLCKNGVFHSMSPYTFEGLQLLIADYVADGNNIPFHLAFVNPGGLEDHKAWHLSKEEAECLPFKSLNTWLKYIYKFADDFTTEFLRQSPYCPFVVQWQKEGWPYFGDCTPKDSLVKMIAFMYSLQIIHANVADPSLFYIFSEYSYALRTEAKLLNSHSLKSVHFMQMIVDESTAHAWVKMQEDLSSNVANKQLQSIYKQFYDGIPHLKLDPRCKSMLPNSPGCSTGL